MHYDEWTRVNLRKENSLRIWNSEKKNLFIFGATDPQWNRARASSLTRFQYHTQRRITVGRNPLDEWSARRRDFYHWKTSPSYKAEQHPVSTNISYHDCTNSLARWQEREFYFYRECRTSISGKRRKHGRHKWHAVLFGTTKDKTKHWRSFQTAAAEA
jgi:hypothetical protein